MIKVDCAVCGMPLDPFDLKPHKCLSKEKIMKPHKHAELIKAWADGAEIEALFFNDARDYWTVVPNPAWSNVNLRFRIKPEPKPDVVEEAYVMKRLNGEVYVCQGFHELPNARFIWDGTTGRLKDVQVLHG